MPNYIDCCLTITGPNRQAVLDKLSGEPYEGKPVYFKIQNVVPRPSDLGDNWQEWSYEHWGCRNVYPDGQNHIQKNDLDLLTFYCPNDEPLLAILNLSEMFPANSFLLESHDLGGGPMAATLFRAGRASLYHSLPDFNSNTGKQATLFEIFRSVYGRSGLEAAQAEADRVRVQRLNAATGADDVVLHVDDPRYDPALDTEIKEHLRPIAYDVAMIPHDEEDIAEFVAEEKKKAEAEIVSKSGFDIEAA